MQLMFVSNDVVDANTIIKESRMVMKVMMVVMVISLVNKSIRGE